MPGSSGLYPGRWIGTGHKAPGDSLPLISPLFGIWGNDLQYVSPSINGIWLADASTSASKVEHCSTFESWKSWKSPLCFPQCSLAKSEAKWRHPIQSEWAEALEDFFNAAVWAAVTDLSMWELKMMNLLTFVFRQVSHKVQSWDHYYFRSISMIDHLYVLTQTSTCVQMTLLYMYMEAIWHKWLMTWQTPWFMEQLGWNMLFATKYV